MPANRTHPAGRRPGRPAASDADARRRLLDAAAHVFAARGYAGTSLRTLAREADVTPAMVAYYFNDKWGLLEAVLCEGLELILQELERATAEGAEQAPLERFVSAYLRVVTAHPWIPRIIVQEVISKDTSLRDLFAERFASRALGLVGPLLEEEARAGRLRPDLDPRLTLMSVIGMSVFPYLAEPVLGRVLDYRIGNEFADRFIPHTLALLRHGVFTGEGS